MTTSQTITNPQSSSPSETSPTHTPHSPTFPPSPNPPHLLLRPPTPPQKPATQRLGPPLLLLLIGHPLQPPRILPLRAIKPLLADTLAGDVQQAAFGKLPADAFGEPVLELVDAGVAGDFGGFDVFCWGEGVLERVVGGRGRKG